MRIKGIVFNGKDILKTSHLSGNHPRGEAQAAASTVTAVIGERAGIAISWPSKGAWWAFVHRSDVPFFHRSGLVDLLWCIWAVSRACCSRHCRWWLVAQFSPRVQDCKRLAGTALSPDDECRNGMGAREGHHLFIYLFFIHRQCRYSTLALLSLQVVKLLPPRRFGSTSHFRLDTCSCGSCWGWSTELCLVNHKKRGNRTPPSDPRQWRCWWWACFQTHYGVSTSHKLAS